MVDFRKALADSKVRKIVEDIIVTELGVEHSSIADDASFTEDLGADSIDILEMMIFFEKKFNIDILDSEAEELDTVGKAIEYLQGRMAK